MPSHGPIISESHSLILKKADWGDGAVTEDSYFVHHEGRVVGRIMQHEAGTGAPSWLWVISNAKPGRRFDPNTYRVIEETRADAMTAFAKA